MEKFNDLKLSATETVNIKGGMRFSTYDKKAWKAKRKELKAQGIKFTRFRCPVTKHACIEW